MSTNDPNTEKVSDNLEAFYFWGVIVGGICPPALILFSFFFTPTLIQIDVVKYYVTILLILAFAALLMLFYALKYSKKPEYNDKLRRLNFLFSAFGVVCFAVLIIMTGGLIQSPLSFHLVYIPSIVAVAFAEKRTLFVTISSYLTVALLAITPVPAKYLLTFFSLESSIALDNIWRTASLYTQTTFGVFFIFCLYTLQLISIYALKRN